MFERLDLQDEGDLVLVRRRVWSWLRALSLGSMKTTRLATAASEASRRRLLHGPTELSIQLEPDGLRLSLPRARWEQLGPLVSGATVEGDDLLVLGRFRSDDDELRERISMGQALQVTEREQEQARRAATELAERLAATNRELTRKQAALQRVNSDLEMIAAAVAHDLRQPLHAVSMFGAVLMASEETAPIGGQVKGAAERMGAMLEGLMQLARIGEAEEARTRISTAFQQVLADLTTVVREHEASIELHGDGHVRIGEAHLRVVLQNLLNNAMKYGRDGVPPAVRVRVTPRGARTTIEVRDNGRGLRRSDFRKVTQLFKRLDRDRQSEGAGVGLALVKRVVDGYGGQLAIGPRSETPGTSILVTLPSAG